jgi:hypothetical protein
MAPWRDARAQAMSSRAAPDGPLVMLIRHAEKPRDPGDHAVDALGRPDAASLAVRGWQRAGALALLFRAPPLPLRRPVALLAATRSPAHVSTRPRDTLQPLADALGLTVEEPAGSADAPERLAEAAATCGGPVLVCARHEALPAIARALGAEGALPGSWPADRYDVVWLVTPPHGPLRQWPQRLLAGDADAPIA